MKSIKAHSLPSYTTLLKLCENCNYQMSSIKPQNFDCACCQYSILLHKILLYYSLFYLSRDNDIIEK